MASTALTIAASAVCILFLLLLTRLSNRNVVLYQTNHILVETHGRPHLEETWSEHASDAQTSSSIATAGGKSDMGSHTWAPGKKCRKPLTCSWWQAMHDRHVAEIQAADAGEGFDVIFYGDSLIEMWKGTRGGVDYAPRRALPGIFNTHFGKRLRSASFGMSGDTVADLQWRLVHGELPLRKQPKVVVVLIGTNDLKDAKVARDASPEARQTTTPEQAILSAVAASTNMLEEILDFIQGRLPDSKVVLMALLPRHKANKTPPLEWPNLYTKGLLEFNQNLLKYSQRRKGVTYLDCSAPFFARPDLLDAELLPDALHPSPAGAQLLASCMQSGIQQHLDSPLAAAS